MKNQLILASGVLCALLGVAHAQDETNQTPPAQSLKDYLRDNPMSLRMLDSTRLDGVRLFASPSDKRQTIYVEIVRRDSEAALRSLAAVMGARIVIDPEIKFLPPQTRSLTFNYVDEDVFEQVSRALVRSENIEMWKSAAGTYFFAAKARAMGKVHFEIMPDGTWRRRDDLQSRNQPKNEREQGPFRFGPNDTFSTPKPQPDWEKREFNGREFYYIPAPNSAQSQQTKP